MRIYLAANFRERDAAALAMRAIEAAGHVITHDWTTERQPPTDPDEFRAFRRAIALRDVAGVRDAEAFVLIDHDSIKGAYVEMGIAIERGLPCVVIRPAYRQVFYSLPSVHEAEDIAGALRILEEASR